MQSKNSSPLPDHHMPSQSIGTRLKEQMLILFLVPFVFFLVASTIHLNRLFLELESTHKINVSILQTVALKNILHEFQNERGMSLLYVSNKGKKFEQQLLAQHRKTDQLIEQVAKLKIFSQESSSQILDFTAQIKALVSLRPRVLGLEMSSDEVLEIYSSKSQLLIRFIRRVVIDNIDTELTRPLATLLTFINMKELMGVERALLASVFTLDHFSSGNYQRFVKLEAERNKYLEIFLSLSNLSVQHSLNGFLPAHLHQKIEAYRQTAHDRANEGNFNIDATQWFNTMTVNIEQLKLLESKMSDELESLSHQRCLQREQEITLWLLGLASVAFITAVCGIAFTKRINRSISVQLQEYNTLFEHSSGAMVIIDPYSKQILYCNSKFLALSGYDAQHVESLFVSSLFKLDDVEETLRLYGNIAKGDCSFIEDVVFYCAQEQIKTVEVATFPIVLKNKNYMVLNIKDVSERIETKKHFEKSQVALQVVLNHLEYAVSVVDIRSGQVIYLNDRAIDIFRDRNQVEPLWNYLSLQGNGKSDTTLSCEYTQQSYHKTSKRWYQISTKVIEWHDDREVEFNRLEDITDKYDAEHKQRNLLHEIRNLSIRNYTLQERERKNIAGDLHDQLGQLLTGILLQTDFIAQCNEPVNEKIAQSTSAIRTTTRELMSSLQNITDQLRPVLLDQLGLIEALQDLISHWQVLMPKINFDFHPKNHPSNVSDLVEISIYRIVQETLTNACKHAKASTIRITIDTVETQEDGNQAIALNIEDDGVGFDPNELHFNRLGLINMRERTEALNGTFKLMSRSGCGVSTQVTIPFQEHIEETKC